jgi:hypothetical protein
VKIPCMSVTLKIRESRFQELHNPDSYKLDLVLMDGSRLSCEGLIARVLENLIKLGAPEANEREECARIAEEAVAKIRARSNPVVGLIRTASPAIRNGRTVRCAGWISIGKKLRRRIGNSARKEIKCVGKCGADHSGYYSTITIKSWLASR